MAEPNIERHPLVALTCHKEQVPSLAYEGDAAYDLRAAEDCTLPPLRWAAVRTGVRLAIPIGYAGLILSRSGLARNSGVTVLNSPGVVDPGYRGELEVLLMNMNPFEEYLVTVHDRVAQLMFIETKQVRWQEVEQLPHGVRGERGYGSSGRH